MVQKSTLILVLFLVFSGCEQIIDLDLNDIQPAIVIEGDLSVPDGDLNVLISRTGSFFETQPLQEVGGANVYLENKNGVQLKVPETEKGYYKLKQIQAEPGDKFKLIVEVDGAAFSAETTVQLPVDIDTISYSYYAGDSFFRPGYRFNVAFQDPPVKKNYYRIRVSKNGFLFVRPADLVVFDDTDLNGSLITVRLHNQYYLEKGEFVVIELLAIDRQAWEYFTSLNEVLNAGPGSPAPANPVSSFNNGAMGFFYAWSYSRKLVHVE